MTVSIIGLSVTTVVSGYAFALGRVDYAQRRAYALEQVQIMVARMRARSVTSTSSNSSTTTTFRGVTFTLSVSTATVASDLIDYTVRCSWTEPTSDLGTRAESVQVVSRMRSPNG